MQEFDQSGDFCVGRLLEQECIGTAMDLPIEAGSLGRALETHYSRIGSKVSMDADFVPQEHMPHLGIPYLAAQAANAGFDIAWRAPLKDNSDMLVLFEVKRTRKSLTCADVAKKLCNVFSYKRGSASTKLRHGIVPYFNAKKLVYFIGGWCDISKRACDVAGKPTEALVEQCEKLLGEADVEGLVVSKENIRSALAFLDKPKIRLMLGTSLGKLSTFQPKE